VSSASEVSRPGLAGDRVRSSRLLTTPAAAAGMLLLAAGFAWLGRWQLDRADTNRALAERFAAGAALDYLEPPVTDAARVRFRRVRLNGHFASASQVLLDNMTLDGRAGYHVLTVFVPASGGPDVLVNRGFVPLGPDRSELPEVAVDESPRVIEGMIDALPRAALDLGADDAAGTDPPVLSFPTLAEVEAALGQPLAPYQLLLDPADPAGFTREWHAPADLATRNVGYAVQWFALALGALAAAIALFRAALRSRVPGGGAELGS